ncbi:MAG: polysaccharide deacetylase family protein [Alphaproteobacteria bacterium]
MMSLQDHVIMRWRSSTYGFLGASAIVLGGFEYISAPIEWLWPHALGGSTHWKGRSSGNCVSLTFDDGPSRYTDTVLDILAERGVRATFFVMGRQVEKFPQTVRRMAAEGHEIGNHTYAFVAKKGAWKLYAPVGIDEVVRTQEAVKKITGTPPHYFRSPGGQMGRRLWRAVRANKLEVVNGALPFPDPERDAETQLATVRETVRPGAIIILHDGDDANPESDRPAATLEMLPRLFAMLEQSGYSVAPLETLLYQEECERNL